MNQQTTQNSGKKNYGLACCAVGCAVPFFLVLVLLVSIIYRFTYQDFGENKATAPMFYAEKGSHFCYDWAFGNRYFEFTIAEQDFLDWCEKKDSRYRWETLEIKDLPSLSAPNRDWDDDNAWPVINERRGEAIPLSITRYNHRKAEHKKCDSRWECQIDPTGKTDDACRRLVDDGYYFEGRHRNGGGVYVLYDREKQRCYIQYSTH